MTAKTSLTLFVPIYLSDITTVSAAQTATFATTQRVLALIRPDNHAEVQEYVRIPNKYQTPIYPISLKSLKGAEPWLGSGALYSASREQGMAERKLIEQALEDKVDKLTFGDSDTFKESAFIGVPNEQNILSTYWRKKNPIPSQINPDRDGCGVIWLCPVFPFDGEQIKNAIKIIEPIFHSYQFEPNLALSCTSGRSIHAFIAIIYDRDVAGEDQRPMECHNKIL